MANSYTTFPDSVQTFDIKTDISSSVYSDWIKYNSYISKGEFANAAQLLQSNVELQKCIVDSVYINQMSKTIEEVQNLFLNDVQRYIHETVIDMGEWNAATKYTKYNFVTYPINGVIQTFECLRDDIPIGTLPTNNTYWVPRIIQGEKGEPGLGLSPRGVWNRVSVYYKNDFVAYNNSFWQCLYQNTNSEPTTSNENWLQLIALTEQLFKQFEEFVINKMSDLKNEMSDEVETLGDTMLSTINDSILEHDNIINSENGAHGIRYYNEELQYKSNDTWLTIETSGGGGSYIGTVPPEDKALLWIDTANSGVIKYYDGTSWVVTKAAWG